MTSTVLDIIGSSLRLIGAIGSGQQAAANEAQDALRALLRMLSSWNLDGLAVYTTRTDTYTLTPSKQAYTIGVDVTGVLTPDFAAPRPNRIQRATLLIPQANGLTLRNPIHIMSDEQWDRTKLQTISTPIPTELYYDESYPLATLRFYGVPTMAYQFELRTLQKLNTIAAVTDTFDFPDGYEEAITYNLAVRLAPEFGAPVSPDVQALAVESKARLMSANAPSPLAHCDSAVLNDRSSYFNWLTGE